MSSASRRRFHSMPGMLPFYPGVHRVNLSVTIAFGKEVPGVLEAFASTDKGCVRSNNEDCCLIQPELGLYVVADGMGGARAGEQASRLAVDTVAAMVQAAPTRDSQVLLQAVEEANRRVLEAAHSDPKLEGMGT